MRNNYFKKIVLFAALPVVMVTASCNSSQQLMHPELTLQSGKAESPAFMDDIILDANAKNISLKIPEIRIGKNKAEAGNGFMNTLQSKYAALLGVLPQAINNFSLYGFIEDWYGVRYRLGGSDKNGIDCSAFVQRLYENVFCINLVRTAFQQFKNCKMVWNTDSLEEGDLVFFHTRGRKRITHVGIYLANNYFVHASSSQGVIISSLTDRYWSRFYAGAGKIKPEAM